MLAARELRAFGRPAVNLVLAAKARFTRAPACLIGGLGGLRQAAAFEMPTARAPCLWRQRREGNLHEGMPPEMPLSYRGQTIDVGASYHFCDT